MEKSVAEAKAAIGSELVEEDPSFAEIVVQFVDGLNDRLDTMERAVRSSDFETLRVAAHQLKGSGGGYGYPALTDLAAELEALAEAQDLDECVSLLAQLKEVCSRVVVDVNHT